MSGVALASVKSLGAGVAVTRGTIHLNTQLQADWLEFGPQKSNGDLRLEQGTVVGSAEIK